MLNYIWLTLLALGILAAVTYDLSDNITDKYQNGKKIEVSIDSASVSNLTAQGKHELNLTIIKSIFNKHYADSIKTDLNFSATLSNDTTKSKSSLYFKITDKFPGIWKDVASAQGDEDDITAEFITENNQYYIVPEKVGFLKMKSLTNSALSYAGIAVEIALGLIGIMAMWLGIMKIAEEAGIINYIARGARPLTRLLFPEIPPDHPAIGSMIMNISATFLGLGNAATPFGIKAMEDLDKLNTNKGTATNAMCTFLVINTASFALMPTTAIALRAAAGSSDPTIIIGTTMFGSFFATVVGITLAKIFEKFPIPLKELPSIAARNMRLITTVLGGLIAFAAMAYFGVLSAIGSLFSFIDVALLKTIVGYISILAIPTLILTFVTLGAIKKVKIYETFVEGAKEGFDVAVTIIPFLVAILMAIGIFRAGGAMDWLVWAIEPVTNLIGFPAEAIPMALMRPLSGSGSLGIMAEIIATHGPDSFIGILVSTFFGSTETTFYVLAVYFGAVNIKNTRHALPAGLIADIAGILAALFIVRLMFG